MLKWSSLCAVVLLTAAPALAQTGTPPSSDPGAARMQPDINAAAPKVDIGKGAEVKSRNPSAATTTRSGSAGISGDRALGASKPSDDSADAYKKDFEKK